MIAETTGNMCTRSNTITIIKIKFIGYITFTTGVTVTIH